jgi:hypothetical protein
MPRRSSSGLTPKYDAKILEPWLVPSLEPGLRTLLYRATSGHPKAIVRQRAMMLAEERYGL